MTELEQRACRALGSCTFLPGTPHKRFARDMAFASVIDKPMISEGQVRQLWRLVYRYRRQIGSKELIEHAQVENSKAEFALT